MGREKDRFFSSFIRRSSLVVPLVISGCMLIERFACELVCPPIDKYPVGALLSEATNASAVFQELIKKITGYDQLQDHAVTVSFFTTIDPVSLVYVYQYSNNKVFSIPPTVDLRPAFGDILIQTERIMVVVRDEQLTDPGYSYVVTIEFEPRDESTIVYEDLFAPSFLQIILSSVAQSPELDVLYLEWDPNANKNELSFDEIGMRTVAELDALPSFRKQVIRLSSMTEEVPTSPALHDNLLDTTDPSLTISLGGKWINFITVYQQTGTLQPIDEFLEEAVTLIETS
jgi:hypothetical protein